ncbi:MAG: beta-galactosidase, partial [Oscillospiraceae bacterium]
MKLTFSCTSNARPLRSGHLKMGDTSADGIRFEVNNLYAVWDSMPVIPIMGEFHYSRYDARQWETELIKMKSCGISVVASYLMWIHHEEEEGIFDFNGNRNVREFVKLCEKLGLQVFLRPGPWVHGEMRNGGFPDWLLRKPFSLRENDEGYLFYVRRLFQEYFRQLKGLLYCDGGPIIGIQLE